MTLAVLLGQPAWEGLWTLHSVLSSPEFPASLQ